MFCILIAFMLESNFVTDVQTDIKIQKGLKILEFATQHNIRKVYYRNCPLSNYIQNKQSNLSKSKNMRTQYHQESANLMSEINADLLFLNSNPSYNQQEAKPMTIHEEQKQQVRKSTLKNVNKQDESQQIRVSELKSYRSDKISSVQDMSIKNQSVVSQVNMPENLQKLQRLNSKKQSKKAGQKATQMQVLGEIDSGKQVNEKKKPKLQNSTLKQSKKVQVIQNSKSHINKSNSVKANSKLSQHQFSLLNKSYQILSSANNVQYEYNEDNTELNILKEMSESFVDRENIRNLLKLQNYELEEKYLEQRIMKRVEKGFKDIKKIKEINWQSLNLPKIKYQFRRPNYANVIE